jgi:hypothetical protein
MEACVDLYKGPRTIPRQSTGLGGVPKGDPVVLWLQGLRFRV